MNNAAKNIAIEKNRAALLRLVRWWLMLAAMFNADRVLPRRIGLWVSGVIYMAEKAAYYLQIASGYVQVDGAAMPVERYGPLTIKTVIQRLKAVKKVLVRLKPAAEGLLQRTLFVAPNRCPPEFYRQGGPRSRQSCRAPPRIHTANYTFILSWVKSHFSGAVTSSHAC